MPRSLSEGVDIFLKSAERQGESGHDVRVSRSAPWMACVGGPVMMRTAISLFVENSHLETRHQGVMFRSLRAFVGSMATLRYEPCTQFINVSQRALHIYWQFSAMSHAIHKIVSKRRCQSYFISRRSPHHVKSKNRDLWASSQSRFLFCLCAAHCSRKLSIYKTFKNSIDFFPAYGNINIWTVAHMNEY